MEFVTARAETVIKKYIYKKHLWHDMSHSFSPSKFGSLAPLKSLPRPYILEKTHIVADSVKSNSALESKMDMPVTTVVYSYYMKTPDKMKLKIWNSLRRGFRRVAIFWLQVLRNLKITKNNKPLLPYNIAFFSFYQDFF